MEVPIFIGLRLVSRETGKKNTLFKKKFELELEEQGLYTSRKNGGQRS